MVSNQTNAQPVRSFSLTSLAVLVFAVMLAVGVFLPQTTTPIEQFSSINTTVLVLGVVAIGLALWTLYDVRGRFISAILSAIIGIIAFFSLFGFVAELSRTVINPETAAHVGIGFWVSILGAIGLIIQLFLPRPKLAGVNIHGEEALRDFMARLGVLGELLGFLWKRKLYWLIPMVMTLMIFIVLIIASSNSAIAPFIYTIF